MLNIFGTSAFEDNYIWFVQPSDSNAVLIIDPGDADPVLAMIQERQLQPVAILITHGCHDHVDGISRLLEDYDIPVYGPRNEFIPNISYPLGRSDDVNILNFPPISVLDIPGHTKGHIGFVIEGNLFCGDALFAAGCGRLHSGPAETLFQSLRTISQLADDTKIYCAHEYTQSNLRFAIEVEPDNVAIQQRIIDTDELRAKGLPSIPSFLGLERKTNPFLRCEFESVKQSVEQQARFVHATPAQVFKSLRLWKDNFQ